MDHIRAGSSSLGLRIEAVDDAEAEGDGKVRTKASGKAKKGARPGRGFAGRPPVDEARLGSATRDDADNTAKFNVLCCNSRSQ